MSLPTVTWDVDPVLFHYPSWLPLPGDGLRYYSLLYVMVFLGGYKLLDWQIRRAGGHEDDANDFVLYGVIAVLAGARFGHVFFYEWDRFVEKFPTDPFWVFKIWQGGLASHGATIGLLFAMWLFTKRRHQSFIEGCDRFSFSAALGSTLIRIGNLFNSEIVGKLTDQTWGFRFPRYDRGEDPIPLRHPSQLYEMTLGLTVMASLYFADRALGKERRPRGALISIFFVVYFTGRFIVEFFKENQSDFEKNLPLTMGQLLSIIPILAGIIGLVISLKKKIPAHWNVPGQNPPDQGSSGGEPHASAPTTDSDVDEVLAGR
ncbi:MAG TPA: prolipoprotein diacylglyceryl transferase [Polyangiaceae bacterium]|nr:prolipoprotein diacylglyceryl transferase [Polyangiaceae bacterium]